MKIRLIACLGLVPLLASPTRAVVTHFDSIVAWGAATSAQSLRVTFEEPIWPVNEVLTGVWTVDGVSFEGFAGSPEPNIWVADFGNPFGSGQWMVANGDENIDVTFAIPPRAIAFDATANTFGAAFIVLFDEAGGEIASLTIPTGISRFVGFTSDRPIARVNYSSTLGAIRDTGFDSIRSAAPVSLSCIGDADGDRDADFADITAVLASFNVVYISAGGPGDADKDGDVDFADITCVLTNFNAVCP